MSDTFNPYRQWLELPAESRAPNYYELLGVPLGESDPKRIGQAADRATARVRACKPGPQAAAWAALLDEIAAAKACLTSVRQKAAYDRALQNSSSGEATGPSRRIQPSAPSAPSIPPPPAPTAIGAVALPSADPMQPVDAGVADPQVDPMAPLALDLESAFGPAGVDPMAPVIPPDELPAESGQIVPVNAPETAVSGLPPIAANPTAAAAAEAESLSSTLPPRAGSTVKRLGKRRRSGLPQWLLGGAALLVAFLLGIGVMSALQRGGREPAQVAAASNNSKASASSETARETADALESSSGDVDTSEDAAFAATHPAVLPPLQPLDLSVLDGSSPGSDSAAEEPSAMNATPAAMAEASPATMPPAPSPLEPTAEQLRAVARSLTTARQAISEQNWGVADQELAQAEAAAVLEQHKEKVRRLQLLRDYVRRFREAIDQTLGRLQPGDQVAVDAQRSFGVVEIAAEKLVIRYNGMNLAYRRSDLPLGLARRLAEMSLAADDPQTLALLAAYVTVHPKASSEDLKKAEQWWNEASSVPDVPDLLIAIGDDYGLQQDLLSRSPDAGAMEQLAARLERLRGSTRLEDYVREYAAAINESLEKVEPGAELAVGSSTTVKIQQVLSDRIVVEFADLKRGYNRRDLPLGLAVALAEQSLPKDTPLTNVMRGAFFAWREREAKPKQFRDKVLSWWQAAGAAAPELQPVVAKLAEQYPE